MLVDDPLMREQLTRLAQSICSQRALCDDLLQEALIHLWITEARHAGQTSSWYLQSCKFHLLHYLSSGRSIDSLKRRDGQLRIESEAPLESLEQEWHEPGESVLSLVCASELMALLSSQLLPNEKAVLDCLADGLGPREIGRRLNISHTMVIKHRCKIASLLTRLSSPVLRINGAEFPRSRPVNRWLAATRLEQKAAA